MRKRSQDTERPAIEDPDGPPFERESHSADHQWFKDDPAEKTSLAAPRVPGIEQNKRRFPTPAERIRSRIGEGRAVHVRTEIATLDTNTRGGLIAGRLTIIGGAPDAGKTSLAVQIAHQRARQGYAVAIHCADEDAEGIQFRIGQQIGLSLEDLEAGSDGTLDRLAAYFDSLPALLVIDQDEDGVMLEETAAALTAAARQHGCAGLVLVVDSVQTARSVAAEQAPSIRERITATATTLKRIAKTSGALVIATCELSRAAYRSRNPKDRVEDMAAFKESGAVEYAMNTGLVLRPVLDAEDEIDVSVPKNKRGLRVPFRLRRDPVQCSYLEIPMPPEDDEQAAKRGELEAKITAFVGQNPGCSVTRLREAMKVKAALVSHSIAEMVMRGVLRREDGPRQAVRLFVAGAVVVAGSPAAA